LNTAPALERHSNQLRNMYDVRTVHIWHCERMHCAIMRYINRHLRLRRVFFVRCDKLCYRLHITDYTAVTGGQYWPNVEMSTLCSTVTINDRSNINN